MTDKHLGETVAALADGHLTGDARERALAHISCCPPCRADVDNHRAMRTRLAALAVPAPPIDVTALLLAMAPQGHRLPARPTCGAPVARRPLMPLERPAVHAFSGAEVRRRPRARAGRRRMLAAGMLAAAALSGGATLGMRSGGVPSSSGPVITPGDLDLARYTQMSRSVEMDDQAPALSVPSQH